MKQFPLMGLALTLAMPLLLSAARPAAAAEIKAIAQAVGSNDPLTISWADSADGKVTLNDNLSAQIHDLFAGAHFEKRVSDAERPDEPTTSIDDWVGAFKQKRDAIVGRTCPR